MLTKKQKTKIENFASKNKWALTYDEYFLCVYNYEYAIKTHNQYVIDCIEYLFDEINYHGAMRLLQQNKFKDAYKWYFDQFGREIMTLKEQRKKSKLTVKELSIISDIPIKTINYYEQNQNTINNARLKTLVALSISTKSKLFDLLTNSEIIEKLKKII